MLDQNTKRKIDTLRDILVGKVPDPKAQVEQITIALIYKFMNDMDDFSVELGGEISFFSGEYKKYAWSNIMSPSLGGFERVSLYAEGIEKMNTNPDIPQLFRDIFRGAFLPYRDPETLNMFLKGINEFNYDHSEDLGDAFEYLLSVLGSQGDAGMFRTPRHIIDMIVEIVAPTKNDTILDPACGTAGFLISAFKHILKSNMKDRPGDILSPDEKKKLVNNLVGYDISPDMGRLSRVNLYLHDFPEPRIYEYDTLTSQDKWNEDYDVILANPPFMTPKGGIIPHNRFSVQAKRSEVLFVDYIAEHLRPGGRAGVIVPEGIVFQTANAYKSLRELLVDKNYLYAVISLPSGVFNPYAGVKTSILLMDKELAKKTDKVLFLKIDNDGFDLGAQRRQLTNSDVPRTIDILKRYRQSLVDGGEFELTDNEKEYTVIAAKEEIGKQDYILVGERYRETIVHNTVYPMVELGNVCEVISGQSPESEHYNTDGEGIPFYQGKTEFTKKYIDKPRKWTTKITKEAMKNDILISVRAPVGPVNIATQRMCIGRGLAAIRCKNDVLMEYLFAFLKMNEEHISGNVGAVFDSISRTDICSLKIPLPPIHIQEQIVTEIEGYQKIIDGARQVVENYKPTIKIDPTWEMVKLGGVIDVRDGTHDSPKYEPKGYPLITTKNIKEGKIDFLNVNYISENSYKQINRRSKVDRGDIIMPMIGTIGNPIVVEIEPNFAIKNVALIKFNNQKKLLNHFVCLILSSKYFEDFLNSTKRGGTQNFISLKDIRTFKIPLPPMEIQQKIVTQIQGEQKSVDECKKMIAIFEQKIKDKISEVWEG